MARIRGSKVESVGRGYFWINLFITRSMKTAAAIAHNKWRKKYYADMAAKRNAKILARKGRGPVVMK